MLKVPGLAQWMWCSVMLAFAAGVALCATKPEDGEIKITNMEKLNTSADEDDPFLSYDGGTFLYASNKSGQYHIMGAIRKSKSQPFANPVILEELLSKADDRSPFMVHSSRDGSDYIYFATQRDTEASAKNYDIYFTRRAGPTEPFQKVAIAPVQSVCTEEDELHPSVTPDGTHMFFSRKTKEGWRIGHAFGNQLVFGKVEMLEVPVGFYHPAVTRDALTMYVQGPVEKGKERQGLFVTKRATSKSTKWSDPAPLPINSPEGKIGDCSPFLSLDGSTLYFASDRPGGKGGLDLYFVATKDLQKAKSP